MLHKKHYIKLPDKKLKIWDFPGTFSALFFSPSPHMAEYCDTTQTKERRNWEYKVCLNERGIVLRLLDHVFIKEN